ncbi:hypothetical protein [Bosea sp. NBC_00550]|uniref:hypothetical protein n=1 Tax=Bosea sp. NBC_00550 TaxID=2969621 RepID=UPI0022302C56|nr:hypothetical protein [Bosea sp. NBC_00550]UZF95789.1 hypothetical protein NWE53_27790 [Bosea sp. NBC_00550]
MVRVVRAAHAVMLLTITVRQKLDDLERARAERTGKISLEIDKITYLVFRLHHDFFRLPSDLGQALRTGAEGSANALHRANPYRPSRRPRNRHLALFVAVVGESHPIWGLVQSGAQFVFASYHQSAHGRLMGSVKLRSAPSSQQSDVLDMGGPTFVADVGQVDLRKAGRQASRVSA